MKELTKRQFAYKVILVILGAGLIGFALKFTTYFNKWYWFPTWPNIGDAAFIFIAGLSLLILGFKKGWVKKQKLMVFKDIEKLSNESLQWRGVEDSVRLFGDGLIKNSEQYKAPWKELEKEKNQK